MKLPTIPEPNYTVTGVKLGYTETQLQAYARQAAEQMREACAAQVDAILSRCVAKDVDDPPLDHVAQAIRALEIE